VDGYFIKIYGEIFGAVCEYFIFFCIEFTIENQHAPVTLNSQARTGILQSR